MKLPDAIARVLNEWKRRECLAATAAVEVRVAQARQEADDCAAECIRLERWLEEQRIELEASKAALAVAKGASSQLTDDLSECRANLGRECEAAEHARTRAATMPFLEQAVARLERDLDAARAALAGERELRISAEREAALHREARCEQEARIVEMRDRVSAGEAQSERLIRAMSQKRRGGR